LIVTLTTQRRVPVVHGLSYFVAAGGLASYGTDDIESYWRVAAYADRILQGVKPCGHSHSK
jgi:putative tryptophan/tyrosine transport system substrate-binding protein